MRTTCSNVVTKIFPSPILPVRAPSMIASTVQGAGYDVIPGWVHRAMWEQVVD